jgi:hypothetical protein
MVVVQQRDAQAAATRHQEEIIVTKKPNHNADIKNPNRGTPGTNKTWDKAQGNRGKQLNPSQPEQNIPRPKPGSGT